MNSIPINRSLLDEAVAALAEPVQEPVAWMDVDDRGNMLSLRFWSEGGHEEVPLYTHPAPQRQPLTEDETMILMNETAGHYWADEAHIQRFRAAIEKAHGIGD